jgi:superfamily II DNA or RNA helicase
MDTRCKCIPLSSCRTDSSNNHEGTGGSQDSSQTRHLETAFVRTSNQIFSKETLKRMQQQTLLPFVLKGNTQFIESRRNDESLMDITKIPNSKLDSMYHIEEKHLSNDVLARHKRTLTMIPIDIAFSNQSPTKFEAFTSTDGILSVPRFYGIEHWGAAAHDETSQGCALSDVSFTGTLNSVQQIACKSTIDRLNGQSKGGILVLPCGYGKTVCALSIASTMKRRTLVLVHKGFLVQQWQERAQTFIPGCTIGKIQQNVINADADIVIGMVQSLSKREYDRGIMQSFGTLIIDESHHMAAPILHKALRQIPAKYILALSATPDRRDGLTCLLYWSMGSVCYQIQRQPEHMLVSCIIYEGGKRKEIKYKDGKLSMALMLNALVEDDLRNAIIADKIAACYRNGRYIIVLTDRIKQLHTVYYKLSKKGIRDECMGFYIGTTSENDRFETSKKPIILSTYSMAKEGLDIPRLDTLILATPKGDIVQASGRIQRKHAGKNTPLLIDIVDTFSVFEQMRWKRWSFYRKEKFECQTYDSSKENVTWFS